MTSVATTATHYLLVIQQNPESEHYFGNWIPLSNESVSDVDESAEAVYAGAYTNTERSFC